MTLSWLKAHCGQTVVVKFGGNAMIDDELTRAFCEDIVKLTEAGIRVVVTHGGGPQISAQLSARGLASVFRGGLRVTSLAVVDVVRDVLFGIGAELVATLEVAGASAVAVGSHEKIIFAARRAGTVVNGAVVDLGQVGEAESVETSDILAILEDGGVPVVSAIGRDVSDGELLNINADAAASSLAVALCAQWLLLLTDVDGLYRDWPDRASLISSIDIDEVSSMLPHLESGMIPKFAAACGAVMGGVGTAAIINGCVPHILVSAPFGTTGTTITAVERKVHE